MPRFEYLLDDLTAEREEALLAREGPPLARLAFLALRYGRTEGLASRLPKWAALFAQLQATPEGQEELVVLVHYLLLVGDEATHEAATSMLDSVLGTRKEEELMLTVGEKLILQGEARGRAGYVLRILAARGVQVDDPARQRILACTDLATLDQWFERALNATRLSDVLGD